MRTVLGNKTLNTNTEFSEIAIKMAYFLAILSQQVSNSCNTATHYLKKEALW